jgi:hypothetical protein
MEEFSHEGDAFAQCDLHFLNVARATAHIQDKKVPEREARALSCQ